MTRTETKGNPPNYHTLHCPCGDGFIWRMDGGSHEKPYRRWMRNHWHHDLAFRNERIDAAIGKTVALAVTFGLAYGVWWLAT